MNESDGIEEKPSTEKTKQKGLQEPPLRKRFNGCTANDELVENADVHESKCVLQARRYVHGWSEHHVLDTDFAHRVNQLLRARALS